ncbi:MBL fold metallo-hydrolase [Massilia atriviolacea]|uniref:MBL fold metallo-hydrolase n=1 Tax=Massilia atriviolacea TaxID=2495579 RepID=A0A430HFR7_9BURK|nr:MBL fold metallo-hydrolase [Massilia atriviolacea]RSZ56368.1 MBL fold metallo-hydrolase [Massilia atriviolacea]
MKLKFLGATGTVTGSKYLLTAGSHRILVDCGLFQGHKELRLRNRHPFPVPPSEIDAVVLTHAHLDHSGYLPLLVKNGFTGKIFCSAATFDLCKILLPDSGHLQEEEANYANRHGFSKHAPALPLYSEADAVRALRQFSPVPFDTPFAIAGDMRGQLALAGHILGAAIVSVRCAGKSIVFSGDLGRPDDPVMLAPAAIAEADFLVVESTYGDKRHDPADPLLLLGKTIRDTAARGGVTIIPSFAVGRAQSLLYDLHRLKQQGAIPAHLPVYLNSPMAADATALYQKHLHSHRLSHDACFAMRRAATIVNSVEESIALNERQVPMVIVAASGMATGGRVLHHLKAFAPDPRNTILFAGFQAGGTRGAQMLAGAESIKIHGQYVPLRARVEQIANLSAHADGDELIGWLSRFGRAPGRTFITHGESAAAEALRRRIGQELGWPCEVPAYLDEATLA